eukprot:10769418-Lingulodinium_polyedra.AAC.1
MGRIHHEEAGEAEVVGQKAHCTEAGPSLVCNDCEAPGQGAEELLRLLSDLRRHPGQSLGLGTPSLKPNLCGLQESMVQGFQELVGGLAVHDRLAHLVASFSVQKAPDAGVGHLFGLQELRPVVQGEVVGAVFEAGALWRAEASEVGDDLSRAPESKVSLACAFADWWLSELFLNFLSELFLKTV